MGASGQVLKAQSDGSVAWAADNDTTVAAVPEGIDATGNPSATTYLRGDGSWATPPNTTYTVATQAEAENPASTTARLFSGQRASQAFDAKAAAITNGDVSGLLAIIADFEARIAALETPAE